MKERTNVTNNGRKDMKIRFDIVKELFEYF